MNFSGISIEKTSVKSASPVVLNDTSDEFQIVGFSEDILISTDDFNYPHHVEPTLAIGLGDRIFVGWKNAMGHNTGGVRAGFSRSSDYGKTWTHPSYMEMYGGYFTGQSDPWLVYRNKVLYYAYLEYSMTGVLTISHITVAKSDDFGNNWIYTAGTHGSGFADKETMTISNDGTIYIAYDDISSDEDSITKVRVTKSINDAAYFSEVGEIVNSADNLTDHVGPYVTTDSNNNLHVAWTWLTEEDWGDVYFCSSYDQGVTFTTPIDINPESENATFTYDATDGHAKATLPVIRFDQNDRLYCLWSDLIDADETFGIFLRYSNDYGVTWSEKYQINPISQGHQWQPDMDIDSQGRVHITYYDQQGEFFRPYYRTLYAINETTDELIISDAIPITSINTSSVFPRPGDYFTVRVDSKDIPHVVWTDGRNDEMDIYYSHGIMYGTESNGLSTSQLVLVIILPSASVIIVAIVIVLLVKKRRKI